MSSLLIPSMSLLLNRAQSVLSDRGRPHVGSKGLRISSREKRDRDRSPPSGTDSGVPILLVRFEPAPSQYGPHLFGETFEWSHIRRESLDKGPGEERGTVDPFPPTSRSLHRPLHFV